MKFLMPVGGVTDQRFGILTTYTHTAIPAGIVAGLEWAGDNCAFSGQFDSDQFLYWLWTMIPHRATCLFVAVPDVVGNAAATAAKFAEYAPLLAGWPLAYVAQDGQEDLPLPPAETWGTLFIGGSTQWKESHAAIDCIRRAQGLGKRIHIGRVNWRRRYDLFSVLHGSGEFTCDGTRTRFQGVDRTRRAWAGYMAQPPLIQL